MDFALSSLRYPAHEGHFRYEWIFHVPFPHSRIIFSVSVWTSTGSNNPEPKFHASAYVSGSLAHLQGEPQVAEERVKHELPRADCMGIPHFDRIAFYQGTDTVRHDPVLCPVSATDDVTCPGRR